MVQNSQKLLNIVTNSLKWTKLDKKDQKWSKWSKMVNNGPKRLTKTVKNGQYGPKQLKTVKNGQKQSKMDNKKLDKNCQKWSKMVNKGQKR